MFATMRSAMESHGSVTLVVRVRPQAKTTFAKAIMSDGSIKIDLAAPADDGKANDELVRFLAEEFSVPVSHVTVVSGHTHRQKVVRISG